MVIPAKIIPPSKYIKEKLEELHWKQFDLAMVLGRTTAFVSELLRGTKKITPRLAQELALVFDTTPQYWLDIENNFRLAQIADVDGEIERRKKLLLEFPVAEMQRRKWLPETDNFDELERTVKEFFEIDDLNAKFVFKASYKRTMKEPKLNRAERAWAARAKQLAKVLPVSPFYPDRLDTLRDNLRKLTAKSQAAKEMPELLRHFGIRFVIVEPIKNARIDGAAFWLDENSPVIALSIRFDNVGSFWFTLFHELAHIKYRDEFSFDTDLEENVNLYINEEEDRANQYAATTLIPRNEFSWFITHVAPYYSKEKINQFANKLKIHPGIIVGQLQHSGEIRYSVHNALKAKVRDAVAGAAFTDGWGQPIPLKQTKTERISSTL